MREAGEEGRTGILAPFTYVKSLFLILAALLIKKEPSEPEPKRVFGSNGLPRIKPKPRLTMPEYERGDGIPPDTSGGDKK